MKKDNRRSDVNLKRVEQYLAEIKKMIQNNYDNIIFEEYLKNNLIFININTNESVKINLKQIIANDKNIDINYVKNYIKQLIATINEEEEENALENYLKSENLEFFYDNHSIFIIINENYTLILAENIDYSPEEIKNIIDSFKHKIRKDL